MCSNPSIRLPLSRSKGLTRGTLWGLAAVLILTAVWAVVQRLNFVPTAFSNRLVDYCIALLAVPVILLALLCVFRSLQWVLLAVWPTRIGVFAESNKLTLCFGPFGTRDYDTNGLDIRYPFELSEEDAGEGGFEALLPEEEQRRSFLPRMFDVRTRVEVDRLTLKFASVFEGDLAAQLEPLIAHW